MTEPLTQRDRCNSETLGDALRAAKQTMDDAERQFRETLVEASKRGASTREMAELLDVPHTTLWRWMQGHGRRRTHNVLSEAR